jgi:predicted transposase/invertase (TIGR01784 family)
MKSKPFFSDDDDIIDIRYDNVFKAVFTKDTPASQGALSALVSALIGRKVAILKILANEPPSDNVRDRQIRFDINCRSESGELIDVEMSFKQDELEPVRLEYHAGKLFTGQDIRGIDKNYSDLKQAYQIAIIAKKKLFPDNIFFHTFEYYDSAGKIPLNGRSRIITLELSKLGNIVKKPVNEMETPESWAFYLRYLTDREKRGKINEIIEANEGIALASEVLMTISRDEEERARLMQIEKIELDYQSGLVTAERKGHAKRLENGRAEGRQEGREEGYEEVARNALAKGLPIDVIHEITGLDIDVIKELQAG